MAMSKEMSTDWQLPGVPQPSSTLPDTRTDGWLLTRVASRLDADPHKLRRFALLLGIDDDTYRTIQQQADVNRQRLPSSILSHWTRDNPNFSQLFTVLQKAEELGLAEKNTIVGILQEERQQASHCLGTTDFKNKINHALRIGYQSPKWQSLSLYPWMNQMASRLSEVYTTLEIEYATCRRTLKDYPELFLDHGSRILVLGKPGIGKTTFTHKVALDWAVKEFNKFQSVFVVKLRDLHPDQTISNTIALQYEEFELSPEAIHNHLTQFNDSMLLILDGLDEIDLKKYPQVNRIFRGLDYRTCCIMTTSRPHIALEIKDEMSCIAYITGFSKESAERYVTHFIPDLEARKEFFKLLAARKMHDMYKVPIILQALALLFDDCKLRLPHTYTAMFNQLVELIALKKIRDGSTGLSEEDTEAAMDETNKVAFECLMKDQLVFPTDSITNEHIFRLGLLSVTKTATPYGNMSLAQFPHKTLMEYAAGGHVATEYIDGRTGAWEKVKKIFSQLFKSTERNSYSSKGEMNQGAHTPYTAEEQRNTINGMKKFIGAIMNSPRGRVATIKKITKVFLDKGFYDVEPDKSRVRQATASLREVETMTEDEFNAFFEFGFELISSADPAQKKKMTERANKLYRSRFDASKFVLELWLMVNWMDKNPDEAIEVLSSTLLSFIASSVMVSSEAVTKQVQWLQDLANSTKILFRFILGKLTRHRQLADKILEEIVVLLLEHAFDSSSGEVLSIHFIQQYLLDLMPEAGLSHQFPNRALYSSEMEQPLDFIESPLVIHINWDLPVRLPDITKAKALSATQIVSNFQPAISKIEKMTSLKLMELHDIKNEALGSDESEQLAKALLSTSLVSRVLNNIQDITLCTRLLENLPTSLLRFTIVDSTLSRMYQLPPVINLQSLHVQDIVPGVSSIISSTTFPHLKRITISGLKWTRQDIRSLVAAVREGRLPFLKHLCIRFGNLSTRGQKILEITRTCKLQTLDLVDTNLTKKDGRILLIQLEKRNLPSIQSLNLLHNSGLNSLVPRFQAVAADQQIDIQCAEIIKKDTLSKVGLLHKVFTSTLHSCHASKSPSVAPKVPHSITSNLGVTDPSEHPTTSSNCSTNSAQERKPALPGALSSHCTNKIHPVSATSGSSPDSCPTGHDSVSVFSMDVYHTTTSTTGLSMQLSKQCKQS